MPVYEVTDPTTGQTITIEGDSPPTEAELEEIFASQQQAVPQEQPQEPIPQAQPQQPVQPQQPQQPPMQQQPAQPQLPNTESIFSVIPEVVGASLSEPLAQISGGIAGAASLPFTGIEGAVENQQAVTDAMSIEPKGEMAKQTKAFIDSLGEKGIEVANESLSGLVGLMALFSGQGMDAATQQIQQVQDEGFSEFVGSAFLEAGAPPSIAALIKALPVTVLTALGIKAKTGPVVREKDLLAQKVRKGSTDVETVGLMPEPTRQQTLFESQQLGTLEAPTQGMGGQPSQLPQPVPPKIIPDPLAKAAVKQGFKPGVVNAVKQSSPTTKANLLEMTKIKQKGMQNSRYEARNRPSDVVGNSLLERYKVIRKANQEAGKKINIEAKKLKGQPVDPSPAVDAFLSKLDEMGIGLDANNKPMFQGSDIEGSTPSIKVVTNVIKRMRETKPPDAYDLHRLKRYIDEQVTYGKGRGGDLGRIEGVLKDLRKNVDSILDENFPDYNEVNSIYSETVGVLDEFQSIAGAKNNLLGGNSPKGVGVLLRRILSNAVSRTRLLDSVDSIENLAKKHGGKFDDDLLNQVLYANELDNRFGASSSTSFQGQIEQAIPTSKTDVAIQAAQAGIKKVKGINTEAAFKSIEELLKR